MSMQNKPGTPMTPAVADTSTANTQAASPGDVAAVLDGMAPTPLRAMLNHSRRVEYDPQDVLYHQGSANQSVIFMTSGLLTLIVHLPNGRARGDGRVPGVTSESTSRILATFKRKQILVNHDNQPDELYNADLSRLHTITGQA